jgi:hypothetical protein
MLGLISFRFLHSMQENETFWSSFPDTMERLIMMAACELPSLITLIQDSCSILYRFLYKPCHRGLLFKWASISKSSGRSILDHFMSCLQTRLLFIMCSTI